jgi:transposase
MLRPAKKAPAQKPYPENPMNTPHYIGFDVHKKTISFCVKTAAGEIVEEGVVPAQRAGLRQWASARPQPWRGAMAATLFSGWIYDTLKPYGEQLEMAHPAKMKAISAGKKKSDICMCATLQEWGFEESKKRSEGICPRVVVRNSY